MNLDFEVSSQSGSYPVQFFERTPEVFVALDQDPNIIFVVDQKLQSFLPQLKQPAHFLKTSEEEKTFRGVEGVCNFLTSHQAHKKTHLIAVGGGVTQEIAAFSAQIYHRGISWSCVPTTLLAMSDSCIGGKNSLNLGQSKNQLGTIYSPQRVMICTEFLKSLSLPEQISGFSEIVKSSLLLSKPQGFFEELEGALQKEGAFQPLSMPLQNWISKSLQVKKHFIEADEKEAGPRRILNYGHTFGHAFEALSEYSLPHGVAIAWGMDVANSLSLQLGTLSQKNFDRLHAFFERFLLGTQGMTFDVQDVMKKLILDKKMDATEMWFILLSDHDGFSAYQKKLPLSILQDGYNRWQQSQAK